MKVREKFPSTLKFETDCKLYTCCIFDIIESTGEISWTTNHLKLWQIWHLRNKSRTCIKCYRAFLDEPIQNYSTKIKQISSTLQVIEGDLLFVFFSRRKENNIVSKWRCWQFFAPFNKVWFPIKLNKQPLTTYETFEEFNSDNNEMMHCTGRYIYFLISKFDSFSNEWRGLKGKEKSCKEIEKKGLICETRIIIH